MLLRERILDTARDLVVAHGWSAVSMTRLARVVGVSRASLYAEIGTRDELAAAVIERETDRFLSGVVSGIRNHADDIVEGLAEAAEFVLSYGDSNQLLRSILGQGDQTEGLLLSLIAVDPDTVLGRASRSVSDEISSLSQGLAEELRRTIVEVFVRLIVSHLLQPSGSRSHAVDQVRTVVRGLFALQASPAK